MHLNAVFSQRQNTKILIPCVLLLFFACDPKTPTPDTRVPQWAKTAVWYQIFPERFRNGDPNNDPTIDDMAGGWPYTRPENWQLHPWTSDWYKLQPWENTTGRGFYWETGLRRYGGDLQGIYDQLDYLQRLGINAIYLNPVFESPSLHKYDATMYHHVDNNFGPDPAGDRRAWSQEDPADPSTWQWTSADSLFLRLISACHERDMRIIIDGVFNHTGNTFWAFKDIVEKQQQSVFKDWYIIKSWDDPETAENEFEYQGWYGVADLPEIREDDNGLVNGIREHIHAIVKRWMDPNGDGDPEDGIDGWRLDVAEMVNLNFWRTFRTWVKEINPNAYLTGEVWWEDWTKNKMFNAAPWLRGDAFDSVMNYRFAEAVKKLVIDQESQIPVTEFVAMMQRVHSDYPKENLYVLQNLMDSHDVDRLASQIVNPDRWYDHEAHPGQNPDYSIRKPDALEIARQKLVVGIQMTVPGAPMIYYGDEAGMWGGDDPDCRKPMIWPDKKYEVESSHPLNGSRPADIVEFDQALFSWYQRLIGIRNDHRSLSVGEIEYFLVDDTQKFLAYRRALDGNTLTIALNNSMTEMTVNLETTQTGERRAKDLITGDSFMSNSGSFDIPMSPYQIRILQTKE